MLTTRERRALLAYARWWPRAGTKPSKSASDGLALLDDGCSGLSYRSVHWTYPDPLLFAHIAESLAYDGTDGP